MEEIFRKTACKQKLSGLHFPLYISENYSSGDNLKSLWLTAVSKEEGNGISRKAKEILSEFSEVFGKESQESFCNRCLYFGDYFCNKFVPCLL